MTEKVKTGKRKGRHPTNALSAAFVRTAKGPALYADGNGLYLKVDETGARRWVQRLTIRGKRREIAIGPVAITSLAEAREAAVEYRKTARAGGDPFAERKKAAGIPTFAEAAQKVHEIHSPSWRSSKHAAWSASSLATYANSHFGKGRKTTPTTTTRL